MPALAFALALAAAAAADFPPFSFRPISPSSEAFYRETLLPDDIDGDGDLDFFSGEGRGGRQFWFENPGRGAGAWERRPVHDSNEADVGAALMDVDGDGRMDKVSSAWWYRNPGFAGAGGKERPFAGCRYGGSAYLHDLYPADMDGDGRPDLLAVDYDGIRWYEIPRDSACRAWTEHKVNGYSDVAQHGGIAAGDLDGDGDLDISRLNLWFENADGKGKAWKEHAGPDFGTLWDGGWGLSGRALIHDLDGDGHRDLIQAECDLPNGRVAWFSNRGGKGLEWVPHPVKDSTDGQDFHSLALADFDGDGDLDLFSSGAGQSARTPTAYAWENLDGKGGAWKEHRLDSGKAAHEAVAADVDGDGDADILAKTWGPGGQYWLENRRIVLPDGIRRGARRDVKRPGSRPAPLFDSPSGPRDAAGRRPGKARPAGPRSRSGGAG